MAKPKVTSQALVQGLQEDLAREYQAIIQYTIFSQVLDGAENMAIAKELEKHAHQELDHALRIARQLDYFGAYPTHQPKPIQTPKDAKAMLRADLQAEDQTIKSYRERIRQATELGEFALAEDLEQIIKQEQDHQIELATALGVTADPSRRKGGKR
ncbi:MAG TPA: ferritin-like domain-containing protein [Kofleriaceae bacterium]|jgi:bacterioferritin